VLREAARLGAWRLVAPGLRVDARRARLLAGAAAEGSAGPGGAGALAILALSGGGPAAEAAAARLGLSPGLREAIRRARLDGPRLLRGLAGAEGPAAAYRLLDGAGDLTAAWARLLGGTAAARRYLDLHLGPWRALPALATGDDVAALGVPRGPAVGALLRELRAAQAAGQVESRAAALRWLTRAARRRAGAPESPTRSGQRGG
jgi:hypothetical protein